MSDIAYKVIVNNNGTDDIIFKTIMLKGNNGSSIASIEKTSTSGNVDTYTVYLDDGTVGGTFTVTNSDASSLNSLTDVTISSAQGGQALIYDGTAGKWKNADIAQSLADQTDVALSSLADGDALVYDSTTSKWKNEALPDELSELDDVAISSAQNGEALIFNAVTGKWQNGDVVENLESLSDVAISSAQDGNVLAYDANTGKWSNIDISIAQSLDDLTDVDITSASDGQALIYDANSGEWKNGSVSTVGSLDDLTDVDITSAVAGDSLRYDGSGWVNQPTKIAMTQAQWNAISDKQAWRNAHKNTDLVLTDAPNLNATSQNLSYDGGVTSTYDEVESLKEGFIKTISINAPMANLASGASIALTANDFNYVIPTGYTPIGLYGYTMFGNANGCLIYELGLSSQGTETVCRIFNSASSAVGSNGRCYLGIVLLNTSKIAT